MASGNLFCTSLLHFFLISIVLNFLFYYLFYMVLLISERVCVSVGKLHLNGSRKEVIYITFGTIMQILGYV